MVGKKLVMANHWLVPLWLWLRQRALSEPAQAPEDLLLVPGVDYALYARIAPLVNADLNTGQVNPLAAPPAVQALLAAAGLQSPPAGGGTDVYRLQARVPLEAGKILLLTQDVALGAALAHTAPWRILRADRQILSPAA